MSYRRQLSPYPSFGLVKEFSRRLGRCQQIEQSPCRS